MEATGGREHGRGREEEEKRKTGKKMHGCLQGRRPAVKEPVGCKVRTQISRYDGQEVAWSWRASRHFEVVLVLLGRLIREGWWDPNHENSPKRGRMEGEGAGEVGDRGVWSPPAVVAGDGTWGAKQARDRC